MSRLHIVGSLLLILALGCSPTAISPSWTEQQAHDMVDRDNKWRVSNGIRAIANDWTVSVEGTTEYWSAAHSSENDKVIRRDLDGTILQEEDVFFGPAWTLPAEHGTSRETLSIFHGYRTRFVYMGPDRQVEELFASARTRHLIDEDNYVVSGVNERMLLHIERDVKKIWLSKVH